MEKKSKIFDFFFLMLQNLVFCDILKMKMQKSAKIINSRPIFYAFLALLLSITATRFLFSRNYEYLSLILVVVIGFVAFCIWKKRLTTMIVVLSVFLFGIGWYFVGLSSFNCKEYSGNNSVVGRVSDNVYDYGSTQRILLKDVKINDQKQENIFLIVKIADDKQLKLGDVISFEAEIVKEKLFELQQFNTTAYRNRAPYTAEIDISEIEVIGNKINFDERIRLTLKNVIYEHMGETHGAVGYAVLFGDQNDILPEIKDYYESAGIIHILSVSGLHITFFIALIGFVLKKCRIRGWINFVVCFVVLALYVYMCGFNPPVVRSAVMGLVFLATKIGGKCYDGLTSLGLAGLLILLTSPLSTFDVGFLMSFFCVLGMFVVSPVVNKILSKIFPKVVASSFSVSVSSQLGILPFMSSIFGTFNILSVLVNLIVVPIFSIIYPMLFCFAIITSFLPFMSFGLQLCSFGFDIIYKISMFFSNTTLVSVLTPISIFVSAALLICLFVSSKYVMVGKKLKAISCSCLLAVCLVAGVVDTIQIPDSGIAYCFNGYGCDSVLITNSRGASIIVDASNTERLLSSCEVEQVSTFFLLDGYVKDLDPLRSLGMQCLVRCNKSDGYEEEMTVQDGAKYSVDGFEFVYHKNKTEIIALEIGFDETKILLLSDFESDATEALKMLSQNLYDIVFLGKQTKYAEIFASSQLASYRNAEFVDKNYLQDGNGFYKINKTALKWRCLD